MVLFGREGCEERKGREKERGGRKKGLMSVWLQTRLLQTNDGSLERGGGEQDAARDRALG